MGFPTAGGLTLDDSPQSLVRLSRWCLRQCQACNGCNYVSVSLVFRDCSWYRTCHTDALERPPDGNWSRFVSGAAFSGPTLRDGSTRHVPKRIGLHECACSATCGTPPGSAPSPVGCGEALAACVPTIPRVEGMALLEFNSVYRLSDMAGGFEGSHPYLRLGSLTILCEERYRGTLLREMLRATASLDGTPLTSLSDAHVEAAIASRAEGARGYALLRGRRGPNNVTLHGTYEKNLQILTSLLMARRSQGRCPTAAADTLVVYLRMGDLLGNSSAAGRFKPVSVLVDELRQPVLKALTQAAREGRPFRRLLFSGVMHFAPQSCEGFGVTISTCVFVTRPDHWRQGRRRDHFYDAGRTDDKNLLLKRALLQQSLWPADVAVGFRSEPDADADLCYLAYAPRLFVPPPVKYHGGRTGSFNRLLSALRSELQARRGNDR